MAIVTTSGEESHQLAEEMNSEMASAVLPVTVFVGIETFFAFFGNLLILYVFLCRYHRCNFKYFVLCLSVIDLTSSLTTMPGEIVTQTHWYVYPFRMLCKMKSFCNIFTVTASALCLLVISVDRYLKVCRPFGWQISTRIALVLCLVIMFLSVVIAVPCAILWGTHDDQLVYKDTNITVTVCEIDRDFLQSKGPLVYIAIVSVVVVLALIIMSVMYMFIVKTLFKKSILKMKYQPPESSKSISSDNELMDIPGRRQATSEDAYACSSGNSNETRSDETGETRATDTPADRDMSATSGPRLARKRTTKQRNAVVRQKTIIMLVLTVLFVVTTVLYLSLAAVIATEVLAGMSNAEKSVYFFFFRLNFINHVVNPWVYGFLDPLFRNSIKEFKNRIVSICFASCGKSHN